MTREYHARRSTARGVSVQSGPHRIPGVVKDGVLDLPIRSIINIHCSKRGKAGEDCGTYGSQLNNNTVTIMKLY